MKICKNKGILIIVLVFILMLIIFGFYKIKEYNILKNVFVFSKDNIVSIWRVKKGDDIHDYNYKLPSDDIDSLSNILTKSILKKVTINDSPSNDLGSMTILLNGKRLEEEKGAFSYEFKRRITLVPIDKDSVYVFLEINKPRNNASFNVDKVIQKFYTINSKELVEFINKNT